MCLFLVFCHRGLCVTHNNTFSVCFKYMSLLSSTLFHFPSLFLFLSLSVGGMLSVRFHCCISNRRQKEEKNELVITTISELPITGLCDDKTNY